MKAKFINEEIGDILKPKSKEEIDKEIKGDGVDKIYEVFPGSDAFVVDINNEEIYFASISVIATSKLDAAIKASKIIGQNFWEQDTNTEYQNYVSEVVFRSKF